VKTRARVKNITFRGVVTTRDEAAPLLSQPGDTVLVRRNNPRLLVMRCPCGCGDDLVINLDRRAGPAWQSYFKRDKVTIFPSYWRDLNCESHFIVWNNRIYWCDLWDEDFWSVDESVEKAVLSALRRNRFVKYAALAEELDLIPWEVLQACRQLESKGLAIGDKGLWSVAFRGRALPRG